MNKRFSKALLASALVAAGTPSPAAIDLSFDYSLDVQSFFGDQVRKDVLEAAGAYFETRINDNLGAITSGSGNSFNLKFERPADGLEQVINNVTVPENQLIVFAGGRDLPGSTIGRGGHGGFSASGSNDFVDNEIYRGQTGAKGVFTGQTDVAYWGGTITFDTQTSWYFDPDPSTSESFTGNDFYSVALHELGHLLGFGVANSWFNLISGGEFTGAASTAANGGSNVPLHRDAAHWQNGTTGLLNGVQVEAAMDPSINVGTRKEFTELDLAALSDIGWEATVVPVPAAAWLFGSAMMGLFGFGRLRRT